MNNDKIERTIKSILNYSIKKVPYYMKRVTLYQKKWEKLPIISRKEVEKNWKEFLSLEYKNKNLDYRSTSGTTGKPIIIFYSPLYYFKMNFSYLKILLRCGYKITKTFLHYDPFLPNKYFFQKFGLYKRIWIDAKLDEKKQLQIISKFNNAFLSYFPTPLLFVIFESKTKNIKLPNFYKIFTQGEILFDYVREYVQSELNATVTDFYGVVEHGLLAYELQENFYELPNELAFLEVVDENNEQVSENERGRILLTTLGNLAFPLIRYEVGDFATVEEYDNECKAISNINRISLEKVMKKKKKIEKLIKNNLDKKEKFAIIYKKDELNISHDKKFLKKKRGKYEFLQSFP